MLALRSARGLAGILAFVGCGTSPSPQAPAPPAAGVESPASAPTASRTGLEGDVTVDAPARGRLVFAWRTAEEQREFAAEGTSLALARKMIERWKIGDEVDFAETPRVHYRIDEAPPDATAVVVLDVGHDFWGTTWGGSTSGKLGSSQPGGGAVSLASNPPRGEEGEPCAGPRYKLIEVASPGLPASKPGPGAPTRRFCAWLPASYRTKPERRYPIIYLFPGYTSNEMTYLRGNRSAGERADALSVQLGREAILVGVDTSSPLGSTYLEDSPVSGAWETFFTKRAMPEIERAVRASPKRTARALVGQSTGGHNALSLGLRRSELFSVIGSSSPDAPDMEAWLLEPERTAPRRAREWFRRWTALEDALGGKGQMTSYAADWAAALQPASPEAKARDGRSFVPSWPFDPSSGVVDEVVVARWVAKSPRGMLRDPKNVERWKRDLSGRVLITVGKNDEFGLYPPAASFAKELDDAGVKTTFVPTDHGHGNGLDRIETAMRFALERLDP
ncbi:MAG TPA: alpha/beta hydrolase-fold protein [Labilithrix sp.]|nr:alpha/beta hydrolase-fold protein [Labilithrix sp.]